MEINVGGTWKQCYTVGCNTCVSNSCSGGCVGGCSGQCFGSGCSSFCNSCVGGCASQYKAQTPASSGNANGRGPSLLDSTSKRFALKPNINVGGTFKEVSIVKINIADTWKNESTF